MQKFVNVYLAAGFEEIEAVTIIDLLRRANLMVTTVALTSELLVEGAHGITLKADKLFTDNVEATIDAHILPGGMPGTTNLQAHKGLCRLLLEAASNQNTVIAAICAAPTVLGSLGLLHGQTATCYPGCESMLTGCTYNATSNVVVSNNIITSRGVGTAIEFALKLIELLSEIGLADRLKASILA